MPGVAPPPYAPFGMGINPMMNSGNPFERIPAPAPGSGVSPLPGGAGFGMGMGMPGMMGMGMGMPGMMGMGGMGMGMGMPGMGMMGGIPPPFAGAGLPWAGNGMMGGMMGGFGFPGMHPPPPPMIDGALGMGKAPPDQKDPTVKPGGDMPGHTIVEPAETTCINRILTNCAPWETLGMPFTVEPMQFDSGWTIGRMIKAMRKPNDDCIGWGVTECLELGGGRWAKGMTYVFGSHQATENTISGVGWGPNRGRDGKEPCYVYCHRI